MKNKTVVAFVLRLSVLTVLYFFAWIFGSLAVAAQFPDTPSEPGLVGELTGLLILSLLNSALIMGLIYSSRWRGWRLVLLLGLAHYGASTFITQVETWYFLTELTVPAALLPGLFLMGLPVSFGFIPLAVLICGKWKAEKRNDENLNLVMPGRQLITKLAVIAVIYLMIYWCAGYFIAWQNPELREFYGSPGEITPFWEHTLTTFVNSPGLVILQLLRGILFAVVAMPIIRGSLVNPWSTALLVGLLLAVPHLSHIIANPLIPLASVRLSHMIETATSTFIFGMIVSWLLHRKHFGLKDLLGISLGKL
ncbi:hypothetical protein [Salinimicrobium xinjiangense]|uniref:hypothetical protein n=1 Tax=Salinimicrobium xinjiangense TaxID=438596 RepID=UPI00041CD1E1|nr:hypothetical protein [Salinimicrobium xinjiangense]